MTIAHKSKVSESCTRERLGGERESGEDGERERRGGERGGECGELRLLIVAPRALLRGCVRS